MSYTGRTSYFSYWWTELNDYDDCEDMIEDYSMDNYEYSEIILLKNYMSEDIDSAYFQ